HHSYAILQVLFSTPPARPLSMSIRLRVVICHPAGIAANYGLPSGTAPAFENSGCKNSGWVMRIVAGSIPVSDLDSKMKKRNRFLSTTFAVGIAAVLASGVTAHTFDLSKM